MSEPTVGVHEREVWIVDFLKSAPDDQRTVRAIWDAAQQPKDADGLGDSASLPTYHRTIAKLIRRAQVEEIDPAPDGSARFAASEQLSPLNTFTLTDLQDALWELSAPEAFAMYIEAVDYYESRADAVLGKAAQGLQNEDPRGLVVEFLQDSVEHLKDDLEDFFSVADPDETMQRRVERQLHQIQQFAYGELGLGGRVWHIPMLDEIQHIDDVDPPSWERVQDAVARHVFGDRFIEVVGVPSHTPDVEKLIVAGSDGSSHAGFVRGIPAPAYAEEEGRLMLTFNNSIAYVAIPPSSSHRLRFPYHGVPMTRSALEDPHNRGMIISRPWFETLSDSEFEHMKKAALDVVQYRVDERLMTGTARAYGTNPVAGESGLLPKPNVLIRDGTVTPQEREFQHYTNPTPYGDVVREGIALSYAILRAVKDSRRRVYGGAVKSTQLRTFSRLINWYIKKGSARQFGKPIDKTWDIARASNVTDSIAVTRVLNALPPLSSKTAYYRTCVIVRPFPAMVTSFRGVNVETPDEWLQLFEEHRERQVNEWRAHRGPRPWLADIDLEDDPYVRMCQEADYAMFYFGRGSGVPQIGFPRFEFMDSLRDLDEDALHERVVSSANMLMTAVHATDWSLDRDHNYLSRFKLPRLVPYVVYEAHEKCKVLGHKLEAELRQAIAANLSQLKALRGVASSKIEIEPVPLTKYMTKAARFLLGKPGDQSSPETTADQEPELPA